MFTSLRILWLIYAGFTAMVAAGLLLAGLSSFDAVCHDSIAEGSILEIIELPGQAWCMNCAKTVTVTNRFDTCPDCGSFQLQVTGGDEMRIKELEVE